jgi:hypothetical protein
MILHAIFFYQQNPKITPLLEPIYNNIHIVTQYVPLSISHLPRIARPAFRKWR